ncbi:MAG: hypothetical protein AB7V62_07045 [Thermoleophilia bacterium]
MTGEPSEPTPEELAAAFAERLARTPVRDVLLQSMATFVDMAAIRLGMGPTGEEAADLREAKAAIEALGAMAGVAHRELPPEDVQPFLEPLAALRMAYVQAVEALSPEERGEEPVAPAPEEPPAAPPPPPAQPDAASRLWVPPGTPRGGASG